MTSRPARSSREAVSTIRAELDAAGDRSLIVDQKDKKNYAELLSRHLAKRFADALRRDFPGILPDATGSGHESRARSSKGIKKLDVNYSTPELGLGLGISIKTINFPDLRSGRYTKNFTRVDAELRAEASDYHERQPWAVMIAVVFLPVDSCDDAGRSSPSSFGKAVQLFRFRANRQAPNGSAMLFERLFLGLYDLEPMRFGEVAFFDVMAKPPKASRPQPQSLLDFPALIREIVRTYNDRNSPEFEWADAEPELLTEPPVEPESSEDE